MDRTYVLFLDFYRCFHQLLPQPHYSMSVVVELIYLWLHRNTNQPDPHDILKCLKTVVVFLAVLDPTHVALAAQELAAEGTRFRLPVPNHSLGVLCSQWLVSVRS